MVLGNHFYKLALFAVINGLMSFNTYAQVDDYFELSLEQLLELKIGLASGVHENFDSSPGTLEIITAAQIQQRGYTELIEVMADLAGVDTIVLNGSAYAFATARGHLALGGVRLMFNGVEDNNLWDQNPYMSRQYPMSNVERIEVLYGPSSVIYGSNAYLAVVNVITKSAHELSNNKYIGEITLSVGSYDSRSTDLALRGKFEQLNYDVSARFFASDEPNYSDKWGFLSNDLYASTEYWGPLLDKQNTKRTLGKYADPSENRSFQGRVNYGDLTFGFLNWKTSEGYGPQFAADKVQNNLLWHNTSEQYYVNYEWQYGSKLTLSSRALYRESRLFGDWAESFPFVENTSFVSLTTWNSDNANLTLSQNFTYQISDSILVNGQYEFSRQRLTKVYDVPGYYGLSFSSTVPNSDLGPHGFGAAIGLSTDQDYESVPPPNRRMDNSNIERIYEHGGYAQVVFEQGAWRYHLGLRHDENSVYGSVVTPRASAIYLFNETNTFKLSYGEGYLAPSALLLYGGFSGRAANPDLKPEESSSIEANWLIKSVEQFHNISFFYAKYDSLRALDIDAELTAKGIEYRGKFELGELSWHNVSAVSEAYINASYTDTSASHVYSDIDGWVQQEGELGGVVPLKISGGIHFQLANDVNINIRGRYSGTMEHHIGNPLRRYNPNTGQNEGAKQSSFLLFDLTMGYKWQQTSVSLKVTNLFDKNYLRSNIFLNSSGDDFSSRSLGFPNSAIPQEGRAVELLFNIKW